MVQNVLDFRAVQFILKRLTDKCVPADRFYTFVPKEGYGKSASFLIGLSGLKLDQSTYQKWRAYDAFHMEKVQPQLEIYGPILPV